MVGERSFYPTCYCGFRFATQAQIDPQYHYQCASVRSIGPRVVRQLTASFGAQCRSFAISHRGHEGCIRVPQRKKTPIKSPIVLRLRTAVSLSAALVIGFSVVSVAAAPASAVPTTPRVASAASIRLTASATGRLALLTRSAELKISSLQSVTASAVAQLAASTGHVLDDSSRVSLNAAIQAAQRDTVAGQESLSGKPSARMAYASARLGVPTEDIPRGKHVAALAATPGVTALDRDSVNLADASGRVTAAVAAWKARQAEIAAQADAAAARAKAAAASRVHSVSVRTARTGAVGHAAAPAPSSGYRTFVVPVRTNVRVNPGNVGLAQAQAAVNAGGEIGIYYSGVGVMDISAHTSNNSTALKVRIGDHVVLTGAQSGTFVVTGAKMVPAGSSASALSSLGTSFAMQNCSGSSYRLVGLQRI
jgi:hypothetical protein